MKVITSILTALMFVIFSFTSCQRTKEYSEKKEVWALKEEFKQDSSGTRLKIYGKEFYEEIRLSINQIEGNYRKTTSPDGQIIISEGINVETNNSLGGTTTFEKIYLTVGENPVARYMKVYKDGLDRRVILQEGEEPQGDTLLKKAINFKPIVTYYNYYGDPYFSNYGISNIIVKTIWNNFNNKIEGEFITCFSKAVKLYKNGNIEYLTQKGITTQPLTGKNEFSRYQEILTRLKGSQDTQKPLLEGIIEFFKEIKDNLGKTVIVLTGYSKIDPNTGFAEGEPLYIEFRIYPPPFRKLTYNQIKGRIQEIEKEVKKWKHKKDATLPYFKTMEYIQKEKEILEKTLKIGPQNNTQLIVYLPEILFYHSGIAEETYTYRYDPKKGNVANSFRGLK